MTWIWKKKVCGSMYHLTKRNSDNGYMWMITGVRRYYLLGVFFPSRVEVKVKVKDVKQ